jgi:ABC-type molybdenum transport system ATPase subunit/photorepair protein PhrA
VHAFSATLFGTVPSGAGMCMLTHRALLLPYRVRVLDEFDVFMDDTYRKIAVDTLLELCDKQPHRQFIFLTPQDMHPFLKDRKVQPRVIKMSDVR